MTVSLWLEALPIRGGRRGVPYRNLIRSGRRGVTAGRRNYGREAGGPNGRAKPRCGRPKANQCRASRMSCSRSDNPSPLLMGSRVARTLRLAKPVASGEIKVERPAFETAMRFNSKVRGRPELVEGAHPGYQVQSSEDYAEGVTQCVVGDRRAVCKTPLGFGFGRFAYPGCAVRQAHDDPGLWSGTPLAFGWESDRPNERMGRKRR